MFTVPTLRFFTSQTRTWCAVTAGALLLLILSAPVLQKSGRVAIARNSVPGDEATQTPQLFGLIISEFRLRGPNGDADEYIEIYNTTDTDHTVPFLHPYSVAASGGVVICLIPGGSVIPAHGHFLCTNGASFSLGGYPSGTGTIGHGDRTYAGSTPDNLGIALFNTSDPFSLNPWNQFDAVGSSAEIHGLYYEGTGYPPLPPMNVDTCIYRKYDLSSGFPIDTGNNANDFAIANTGATTLEPPRRLGAPGPQDSRSPIFGFFNEGMAALPLDATKTLSYPPNRVRDNSPDPPNNSTFGTVSIRRRFVNSTGAPVTRLRFRVIDISNNPATPTVSDLRPRTSNAVVVAGINDAATCAATGTPATPPCTITVQGTTLETPPAQTSGGGLNSSLAAGTVTLGSPLANGDSVNLQFLFGVQSAGNYHLELALEALPKGGGLFRAVGNNASIGDNSDAPNMVADYDGDGFSDISVFRPSDGNWYLLRSASGYSQINFGLATDKIAPGDYDGDGKTDLAVYRPSTGFWYIINSATGTLSLAQFGAAEDLPTPADYDGDGRADISVFRPSDGSWYRRNSRNGAVVSLVFGLSGDKPTLGDFDGDGKFDIAVYRPSDGGWYRLDSSTGALVAVAFGLAADIATPGDFDGDGKTDISVFRPSDGTWYRLNSSDGAFQAMPFGLNGDIPATGDFDLDGKEDISVFRPSDGTWYRLNSSNGGFVVQPFGRNGDRPTPAAFQY